MTGSDFPRLDTCTLEEHLEMVRKAGGYTFTTSVRFITSPDLPPFEEAQDEHT